MASTIDEVFRASGFRNLSESPVKQKNDDLSNGRNFYDHVLQSIAHHDDVLRSAFKKFEFYGVVLKVNFITDKDKLISRTSRAFTENLLSQQGDTTKGFPPVQEIYVHIPEFTGLLPQVSVREVKQMQTFAMSGLYSLGEKQRAFATIFQRKVSRYPRFYTTARAEPLEIWKVRYPDKNFLYYGFADQLARESENIMDFYNQGIMGEIDKLIKRLEGIPSVRDAKE